LHQYELTVVISPDVAEEGIPDAIEKITRFISQRGGSVTAVDRWGRKKLAYPIKHYAEGDYVVARVELEPSKIGELESNLRLAEEFLRHLLVRVGD
jgi:small subunit ribosomal protein S6